MTADSAGGPRGPAGSPVSRIRGAPARAASFLIELYRTYISPMRPPTCRFTPTCSEYAVGALREWGLLRGLALASWRLAKCGPWYPGGWDPVPRRHGRRAAARTEGADAGAVVPESIGYEADGGDPPDTTSGSGPDGLPGSLR